MNKLFLLLLFFIQLSFSSFCLAELTMTEQQLYMQQAMELLKNSASREEFFKNHPQAREAQRQLQTITESPELQNEIYGLAADVFADLVKKTAGEPNKLMNLLQNAQQNPEGFANQFSTTQKQELQKLGVEVLKLRQPSGY
ncbi:MAG: hypothetical protein HQL46_01050 [Gammaproteobacteria bacterium]|nr:hypothetical protein [Gammaproteobacteria bacterium]